MSLLYLHCKRTRKVQAVSYLAGTDWNKKFMKISLEITKEVECVRGTSIKCEVKRRTGDETYTCGKEASATGDCRATIVNYMGRQKYVTNGFGNAKRGETCQFGTSIKKCLPGNKLQLQAGHVKGGIVSHPPQWKCHPMGWTWGFGEKGGFDHVNKYGPYGSDGGEPSAFPTNGKRGWCFTKQGKWGGVMIDPAALEMFQQIRSTEVGVVLALD